MSVRAIARGMVAGLAGVAAMTVAEKLEQALTGRPNSYVPGHTLERLLGRPRRPDEERFWMNHAMHWGQGALLGAVRGVMAERGFRGPVGSFAFLNLRLVADQTLENATGVGAPPWTWPVDEQAIDLLHKGIYAFATGAVADRLIEGPPDTPAPREPWRARGGNGQRERGRSSRRAGSAQTPSLPKARFPDAIAATADVLIPTIAKGVIIRRPRIVAMAEAFDLDRRAVRRMQRLRRRYGPGPVLMRNPLRPRRYMALLLSPHHVHRVLQASPEPFATSTYEKRGALSHFQPKLSLISHGAEREERVRFNDEVLDADRHAHRLTETFLRVLDDEAADVVRRAERRGELVWDDFFDPWFRMVRRLVFGESAREDRELIDMIERLRSRANWSVAAPVNRRLRERFLARIRDRLDDAEPGSIASVIAKAPTTPTTAPEHQVPQWLFAFDPAAMATFRALALLATHPDQAARARAEIRRAGSEGRDHLPFLRACVLESLRLWPTAPMVLRETTRETQWEDGTMPAHTHVLAYAPYFHRDDEHLAYANRFAPEVWLEDDATPTLDDLTPSEWPLFPFSAGSGMCPGRHVVLLVASNMLAALMGERDVRLTAGPDLDPRRRMPGTLNNYGLRFRLEPSSSVGSIRRSARTPITPPG